MARTRLVVLTELPEVAGFGVTPEPVPARATVTCTPAATARPRWPRPRLAPPPTLQ